MPPRLSGQAFSFLSLHIQFMCIYSRPGWYLLTSDPAIPALPGLMGTGLRRWAGEVERTNRRGPLVDVDIGRGSEELKTYLVQFLQCNRCFILHSFETSKPPWR